MRRRILVEAIPVGRIEQIRCLAECAGPEVVLEAVAISIPQVTVGASVCAKVRPGSVGIQATRVTSVDQQGSACQVDVGRYASRSVNEELGIQIREGG